MKKSFALFFMLSALSPFYAQKFEAEAGVMQGAKIENVLNAFSGKGYVKFMEISQGSVELQFNVKKDGEYAYEIIYALEKKNSNKQNCAVKVEVDGLYVATQKLSDSNTVKSFGTTIINNTSYLTKGDHKLKVTGLCTGGEWYFDTVKVMEVSDSIKEKILQPQLCNPNASAEAKNLYEYLCQMRGKGILSGQQIYGQNDKEIKVIQKETGKYPAVLGIDLIDFTPSRVERGANGGRVLTVAKRYWEAGGIITCCWHWNAPAGLVDKDLPEMHWYDGFRTKATTFDFSRALVEPESEEYQLLIRDIDEISSKLKVLRDGNVPVLWRPLHEASGKWFWWGSKGSEAYIELYKLMYDRMVNYHKLDNLIWVWNGQDPAWYPGDDCVDIISYDYYPMKHNHGTADEYLTSIQRATEQSKLCALSENGVLPNVVKLEKEKSVWAWWCTWNGDFVVDKDGNYSSSSTKLETLKLYYENPYTITRDELPSLK